MPITNQVKVEMLVDHKINGSTLTEIGEDFGVSRKTVRRRIDEVQAFLDSLSVGSKVPVQHEDSVVECTIVHIDEEITDDMPVSVEFPDGVADYVLLADLMDATGKEAITDTKVVEKAEKTPQKYPNESRYNLIPVGTVVQIAKDSEYYGRNIANPINTNGVVTEHTKGIGDDFMYRVSWDNGTANSYKVGDLVLVEPEEVDEPVEAVEEDSDEVDAVEDNAQYFVTAPQDSLTIVRIDSETGDVTQRQTNKHNPNFLKLRNRIKEDQSQETLREIYNELDTTRMLEAYSVGRVKVNPQSETVVFVKADGYERSVPDDIAMDIITTVREYGKDQGDRLVRFLDKLMDNVSFKAIEGLYRFMKHNCIEINEDGSIQAWKGVRSDLHSCHSGKIKNSPSCPVREDGRIYNGNFGAEIRVDRSEVNDDPDVTCSHGLHVGNRDYANSFGDKLLRVKVQPQDVVAVPKDYNGAKMRCCAYTPLEAI